MALQTTAKLTYEDYLGLPDDGKRYEILDGELCRALRRTSDIDESPATSSR
jgi:hypothetical protein